MKKEQIDYKLADEWLKNADRLEMPQRIKDIYLRYMPGGEFRTQINKMRNRFKNKNPA